MSKKAKKHSTKTDAVKRLSEKMIAYYNASRRLDEHEPTWVLPPFDLAFNGNLGELSEMFPYDYLQVELCDDTVIRGYESLFGICIVQGGFKIGTSSWVFLGRRDSPIIRVGDWLACRREVSESAQQLAKQLEFPKHHEFWALYSLDDPTLIFDRSAGSYEEICEIAAHPRRYGVPISSR